MDSDITHTRSENIFVKLFRKIDFFVVAIFLVSIYLFARSYIPGTFLTGWDNLHPEFAPVLNISRSLFGVWQDYRGLGLYDGQSHVANLVHDLLAAVLSHIVSMSLVRYIVMFLLHSFGMIGMYFFLKHLIKEKWVAFIAALFYGLNIATVQQFYAPFEVFIYHFAFLPWIWLVCHKYITEGKMRLLLIFIVISFLASPQGFVPTVFLVSVLGLIMYFWLDIRVNRSPKRFIVLMLIYFAANAFWLIPYVYGAPGNASRIKDSRINEFSSELAYIRNQQRGDLVNALQMKGFMLDVQETDGVKLEGLMLMKNWRNYSSSLTYSLGYSMLFGSAVFGAYQLAKNRKSHLEFLLIPGIIGLFFLANNTVFIRDANTILRSFFPILNEALRFPFTKFCILFSGAITVYLAYGLKAIFVKYQVGTICIGIISIFIISFPALFGGDFVSPLFRRQIPSDYFKVFDYFHDKPIDARIALMPINTFWSWQHKSWGYAGSDFLWFGIKQPIMSRAFDPWSSYNEQFYNEIYFAYNNSDGNSLLKVLSKYEISYLLLDKSLLNDIGSKPIDYEKFTKYLSSQSKIKETYKAGNLVVYSITRDRDPSLFVVKDIPVSTNSQPIFRYEDKIYGKYSDYHESLSGDPKLIAPFSSIFSEKLQSSIDVSVEQTLQSIIITPKTNLFEGLSDDYSDYTIRIKSALRESYIPVQISLDGRMIIAKVIPPSIEINGKRYHPEGEVITSEVIDENIDLEKAKYLYTDKNDSFRPGDKLYILRDYPNIIKVEDDENEIYVKLMLPDVSSAVDYEILMKLNRKSIAKLIIPKITSIYSIDGGIWNRTYLLTSHDQETIYSEADGLRLFARTAPIDVVFYNEHLPRDMAYVILADATYHKGLPMTFYVGSDQLSQGIAESRLDKKGRSTNIFFVPPTTTVGSGYSFHFTAIPLGRQITDYTLHEVAVFPIPYDTITSLEFVEDQAEEILIQKSESSHSSVDYSPVNPVEYQVEIDQDSISDDSTLVMSTAFDNGWIAYQSDNTWFPFFGKRLEDHVLVNNWSNGWKLPSSTPLGTKYSALGSSTYVVLFWPQYLVYLGFLMLVLTGVTFLLLVTLQRIRNN